MSRLQQLFAEHGQSPWLGDMRREYLGAGQLARLVEAGIRGVTADPTIFANAISGSAGYEEHFRSLIAGKLGVEDVCWDLVVEDIERALDILRPVFDDSGGGDGFASLELPPSLAHDTLGSIVTARALQRQIGQPNLFVKVAATNEGVAAAQSMIGEGRNINISLISSLARYDQVIDAYLSGLEVCPGDLSGVASVASFLLSRLDSEVDGRLERIGTDDALVLRGRAAVALAKLAYRLFQARFSGPRWDVLAARGARVQRPLWVSTSSNNRAYSDTLYVDSLIGPDTVSAMSEQTVSAFEDHGTLHRTVEDGVDGAEALLSRLERLGIGMADVGAVLEAEGVARFARSYDDLLANLTAEAAQVARR